jgi:hypothetical protein
LLTGSTWIRGVLGAAVGKRQLDGLCARIDGLLFPLGDAPITAVIIPAVAGSTAEKQGTMSS